MVSVLSFYILNIHSFVFQKVNILVSVAAVLWERSLKRHHILLHIIVQCSPRRHNFGFIVQARTTTALSVNLPSGVIIFYHSPSSYRCCTLIMFPLRCFEVITSYEVISCHCTLWIFPLTSLFCIRVQVRAAVLCECSLWRHYFVL